MAKKKYERAVMPPKTHNWGDASVRAERELNEANAVADMKLKTVYIEYEPSAGGRPQIKLTDELRKGILVRVKKGLKRGQICASIGISVDGMRGLLKRNPDFAAEFTTAERARDEACSLTIWAQGRSETDDHGNIVTSGDPEAATSFINTEIKAKHLANSIKNHREEIQIKREELGIKKTILEKRFGTEKTESKWDLDVLGGPGELEDFSVLHRKARGGEPMTDAEKLRYGDYAARLQHGKKHSQDELDEMMREF